MKVVLDTNVFISGVFFRGPPYRILQAWREGAVRLIVSPEILDEYRRVNDRLGLQFKDVDATPILALVARSAELVSARPLKGSVCEDTADDKFLAAALAGASRTVVSGDKHLLRVSGYEGLEVLRPRAFVERYLT